ncbi:hypothetical protein C343_03392 [Cryptococcus neoformans C23]|uniref:Uncharacterized protein n=2 Tax=Cryptococcus neoformans TaxID=5207 RepID=A0A854QJM4_CRYNE|nr:hypothetical protein CNAG_02537 [Cryptococcus neoformans var. grubii H99]AUB25083.1 hypothetical protein CKF44_02537 [Cryptococcus neoformans var. grubii]OWZ31367.1 hypothetical protein C347_03455 [Cryptococcus neoformans var. grubii AD2-60a]OWZ42497.1 hypothetical protein C353_03298 [Cryptococcus neoformans var. grubii AD1-83a]OWZ43528.1 hypothetical protein C343_03392 [Cryptococcus neoformans var. grubii C23]OXC84573.1 hypothetical protein C344_03152 [Cryptococcus neoformans var. grubii A|eukprot:XP_012050218.1 hypothetical protein CNAG_02537 [Cryptococcus neoformans var. grubii H99]
MSASQQSTKPEDSQQSDEDWIVEHCKWLDQTLASEHPEWTAEKRQSIVEQSMTNTIKLTNEVFTELSAKHPEWTEEQLQEAVEEETIARSASRLINAARNWVSEQGSNASQR